MAKMTYSEFAQMSMEEKVLLLGYAPEEITSKTYIYLDTDMELCGIEKNDRYAYPEDEFCGGAYVAKTVNLNYMRGVVRRAAK